MLATGESFRKSQASCLRLPDPPCEAPPAHEGGSSTEFWAMIVAARESENGEYYRNFKWKMLKIIGC
jgi:hypothetical protein